MTPLPRTWHGSAEGPALVFVNSLGTTQSMWDGVLEQLGSGMRALTYDLPGHTGGAIEPFTFDDLVAESIAVMDSEGVRAATLAGVSLGGAIGIEIAARRPDLVEGLVVVNAPIRQASSSFWTERADTVEREGLAALSSGLRERWFPEGGAGTEAVVAEFAALDPAGYAAACRALADLDVTAAAQAVTLPTLVVSARDDASVAPTNSDELAASIPGAVLEVVDEGGHLLPVTRPGLLAEWLISALHDR
ncbi:MULTISPECIES: alpha/beta fold hydrolase [unclassified Microbacterium]|uniref:alpha/beta fold hydrolase n=1 Tax=unclassified Microbacterium TaxID=2609290 RepID=UPI00301B64EF